MDADGNATAVITQYQGKPFNSPNDLVIHRSGAVYAGPDRPGQCLQGTPSRCSAFR